MIESVPSWHPQGGTDFSHNLFLGGHYARLIENELPWPLDVTFGEDKNKTTKGHAGTNLSLIRKVA